MKYITFCMFILSNTQLSFAGNMNCHCHYKLGLYDVLICFVWLLFVAFIGYLFFLWRMKIIDNKTAKEKREFQATHEYEKQKIADGLRGQQIEKERKQASEKTLLHLIKITDEGTKKEEYKELLLSLYKD